MDTIVAKSIADSHRAAVIREAKRQVELAEANKRKQDGYSRNATEQKKARTRLANRRAALELLLGVNAPVEEPEEEAETTGYDPLHGNIAVLFASEITTEHYVLSINLAVGSGIVTVDFPMPARVREASLVGLADIVLVIQPDGTDYEDQSITFTLPLATSVKITV